MSAIFSALNAGRPNVTENGAPCYETTKDTRLDAFSKLVRGLSPTEIEKLFGDIYGQAERAVAKERAAIAADLALLWVSTRAVREGKGERRISHVWFCTLSRKFPQTASALVKLIPHYGCWRDVFDLMVVAGLPVDVREVMLQLVLETLRQEMVKLDDAGCEEFSLCAKWAPRPNSARGALAKEIAKKMFHGTKDAYARYRKLLSAINERISTVEVMMSNKHWAKIVPKGVPARCLTIHRNAFMNETKAKKARRSNDPDRVSCAANFKAAIQTSGNLHGRSQQPHEIVKHFMKHNATEDPILESQWRDTVTRLGEEFPNLGKLMVLADVSGSMVGDPMAVSVTFGILGAALGSEKGSFMTFQTDPQWVQLPDTMNLRQKVRRTMAAPWGGSTDLLKAMTLVLTACVRNKVPNEDVEELRLLVVSDMQFNQTSSNTRGWETTFQSIQRNFRKAGYTYPPVIIFWNVRASKGFVAPADVPGVIQLSGFSPNLLRAVMGGNLDKMRATPGGAPTSLDVMRAALDDDAYAPVRRICADIQEGLMAGYVPPLPAAPTIE